MLLGSLALPFAIAKISTADFASPTTQTFIEIDGVNYGAFDAVDGLSGQIKVEGDSGELTRVTFRRDFVADPSLFLWAKNTMHERTELKDVHVITKNRDGSEANHFVLRLCQPLSLSVEAANPALGGYHEKVDMAVQEIVQL